MTNNLSVRYAPTLIPKLVMYLLAMISLKEAMEYGALFSSSSLLQHSVLRMMHCNNKDKIIEEFI